jgi:hypothetical protein
MLTTQLGSRKASSWSGTAPEKSQTTHAVAIGSRTLERPSTKLASWGAEKFRDTLRNDAASGLGDATPLPQEMQRPNARRLRQTAIHQRPALPE